LAVRAEDLSEKEAVLAANTKAFFTIPHFDTTRRRLFHTEGGDAESTPRNPRRRLAGVRAKQAGGPVHQTEQAHRQVTLSTDPG
jgi:hypothetical protein